MTSKAVVFDAAREVSVREIQCPEPGPEDVVVAVTHSWISNGTEGSFLRGERIAGDTPRKAGDPSPFPIVAGYQKVGIAEWVGEQVSGIEVGDTVFCTIGKVNGMFESYGGQVSPSVCHRDQVWKLPATPEALAFSGLVLTQVGYNCGARPKLSIGDATVVVGDGMVGIWAAQTLAWRGARVILIGHHKDRMEKLGAGYGRAHRLATGTEWIDGVRDSVPEGIQVLVDTVGSTETILAALPAMRRFGHVVSAGFYGNSDQLPLQPLRYRELAVELVSGWTRERMNETLGLVAAGMLETLPLITHHFAVDRAAEAWDLIEGKGDKVLGVVLDWSEPT